MPLHKKRLLQRPKKPSAKRQLRRRQRRRAPNRLVVVVADSKRLSSAVVLLSAGLDSSFGFLKALKEMSVSLALTFDYGQRAAVREIERAGLMARAAGVEHKVISLPWFKDFTKTSLVSGEKIPSGKDVSIDDLERSFATAKSVWVPNRNGILLSIAAGFAEGLKSDFVIPGFNAEEAATFPDNSGEYLHSLDATWKFSTATGVRTHCFSTHLNKTQIVAEGQRLGMDFRQVWPCYFAESQWCGECESCQRFKRALSANGLSFEELRG
ncbi:MAG: 7-cyano-7-deazaguanine synthase QueC [Bdellovibrionales bacterium]|nr:7-cyano-7-deazaguanine synthase QueC [Bdellovibrionales bacterium]